LALKSFLKAQEAAEWIGEHDCIRSSLCLMRSDESGSGLCRACSAHDRRFLEDNARRANERIQLAQSDLHVYKFPGRSLSSTGWAVAPGGMHGSHLCGRSKCQKQCTAAEAEPSEGKEGGTSVSIIILLSRQANDRGVHHYSGQGRPRRQVLICPTMIMPAGAASSALAGVRTMAVSLDLRS
jgi:hypothetical protein